MLSISMRNHNALALVCTCVLISGCGGDSHSTARPTRVTGIVAEFLLEAQQALGAKARDGESPTGCRLSEEEVKLYPEDVPFFLAMREENIKGFTWSSDNRWSIYLVSEAQGRAFNLSVSTIHGRCNAFEIAKIEWRDSG